MHDDKLGAEESEDLWDWSVSIYHELSAIARDIGEPDAWLLSEYYADHGAEESDIERARASVNGLARSVTNWWRMLLVLPRHPLIVDVQAVVYELRWKLEACANESSIDDLRSAVTAVGAEFGMQLRLAAGRVYARWCGPPQERPLTKDGPTVEGCFRWKGRECTGLQPVPWRLLRYAWNAHERRASFDGLAESVWLDRERDFTGAPLKQAAQSIRAFFRRNRISLTCIASERWRTVSIAPVCKEEP